MSNKTEEMGYEIPNIWIKSDSDGVDDTSSGEKDSLYFMRVEWFIRGFIVTNDDETN